VASSLRALLSSALGYSRLSRRGNSIRWKKFSRLSSIFSFFSFSSSSFSFYLVSISISCLLFSLPLFSNFSFFSFFLPISFPSNPIAPHPVGDPAAQCHQPSSWSAGHQDRLHSARFPLFRCSHRDFFGAIYLAEFPSGGTTPLRRPSIAADPTSLKTGVPPSIVIGIFADKPCGSTLSPRQYYAHILPPTTSTAARPADSPLGPEKMMSPPHHPPSASTNEEFHSPFFSFLCPQNYSPFLFFLSFFLRGSFCRRALPGRQAAMASTLAAIK